MKNKTHKNNPAELWHQIRVARKIYDENWVVKSVINGSEDFSCTDSNAIAWVAIILTTHHLPQCRRTVALLIFAANAISHWHGVTAD
jgi:hypothetical protein